LGINNPSGDGPSNGETTDSPKTDLLPGFHFERTFDVMSPRHCGDFVRG
jgi:hypothetical protein